MIPILTYKERIRVSKNPYFSRILCSYRQEHLGSYQTSIIEVHYKNYYRIKPVNYLHKGSLSPMFDWVLNTPLTPKNSMLDLIMACFTTLHQTPYKFLKWLCCFFDKNCTKNEVFHEGFLQ